MLPFILLSVYLSLATPTPTRTSLFETSCEISTEFNGGDLNSLQPLILDATKQEFRYPNRMKKQLGVSKGESIRLACSGPSNHFKNIPKQSEVTAKCIGGNKFVIGKDTYLISDLTCTQGVGSQNRQSSGCINRYTTIEIGFQLKANFVPTIQVCRDNNYVTHYTKITLSKEIQYAQSGVPRPSWNPGAFYGNLDMNALYNTNTQALTLSQLLKFDVDYIKRTYITSQQLLTRGHMAAKGDFIYGPQQKSTFWFINSAPQWSTTNQGNWNSIENSVRQLVSDRRLVLDVYTGVHEIMQLPDRNNVLQDIYLSFNESRVTSKQIPVPKYFWKVIHDPIRKTGVAFVGLNNPFATKIPITLCEDISSKLKWLTWQPKNIIAGYSYACTVSEARKRISDIPANMDTTKGLII